MIKKSRFLLFIIYSFLAVSCSSAQNTIDATIEIDSFGNLFINEDIKNLSLEKDTLVTDSKILIHKDEADLIGGTTINSNYLTEYKPKQDKFKYLINLPKRSNAYFKNRVFFMTTINYLLSNKQNFLKKKIFNLKFKNFNNLIYPTQNDLQESYLYPPPIISGNFQTQKVKDWDVYWLENKNNIEKTDVIVNYIDEIYNYYAKKYGKKNKKIKIIFIPFKNKDLLGKTLDNVILLNEKMLSKKHKLEKRLLAHEVAHLWWGVGGLQFKERVFTEGIAEFMALEFLKFKGEKEYVNDLRHVKNYISEGIKNIDPLFKVTRDSKIKYSYNFIPILLNSIQHNSEKDLYEELSIFYSKNLSKIFVNINDLNHFLKKNNTTTSLITKRSLPEYFIEEDKDSIMIYGITKTPTSINIEIKDTLNNKKTETLFFSDRHTVFKRSKLNLKRIIIDPKMEKLQFSRLNDIWTKDQNSLLAKNRYFNFYHSNKKAIEYASEVINYLSSNNNDFLTKICGANKRFINTLKKTKSEINKNGKIIFTGASANYKENINRIDVKATYYLKSRKNFDLIYFQLFTTKNLEHLIGIKIITPKNKRRSR
ncbi:hypothetical protein [Tenacibaculum amylolyticum]|uniref:hypothetical protein n=1 Tax=Tenacibaculum amylolyticum TaxID=104269 RepID=UPI00389348AB